MIKSRSTSSLSVTMAIGTMKETPAGMVVAMILAREKEGQGHAIAIILANNARRPKQDPPNTEQRATNRCTTKPIKSLSYRAPVICGGFLFAFGE